MSSSLEHVYRSHHEKNRGEGFVLLGEARGAFLRRVVGTGKKVLDIGCRDGALTSTYCTDNEVTGVDIDSTALAKASTLGITTRQMDLNGLWDFVPNSFDAVVAAEVVEHLYYPDAVFEKIARVLTPGGVVAGTVPNAFSLANRARYLLLRKRGTPLSDPTHINQFIVAELRDIMSRHFNNVHVEGIGRLGPLAKRFPQEFAFDLCFSGTRP